MNIENFHKKLYLLERDGSLLIHLSPDTVAMKMCRVQDIFLKSIFLGIVWKGIQNLQNYKISDFIFFFQFMIIFIFMCVSMSVCHVVCFYLDVHVYVHSNSLLSLVLNLYNYIFRY